MFWLGLSKFPRAVENLLLRPIPADEVIPARRAFLFLYLAARSRSLPGPGQLGGKASGTEI